MIIGWLQSQLSSGNHFQKTSVTDRQTDRVQTYSPLRFHRWGTNNKELQTYRQADKQTIQILYATRPFRPRNLKDTFTKMDMQV